MGHADSMKARLLFSLLFVLGVALSSAETYRSVEVSKLKFEGPKEEVEAALGQDVSAYIFQLLDARLASEAYLTLDDPDAGELQQEQALVVFRGDAKLPLKGAIDLALDYTADEVKTFRFSIPDGSAKVITEDDFLKARRNWAERRSRDGVPGKPWFNHQSDHGEAASQPGFRNVDVADTFDIFSGGRAIADNLALNRDLILAADKDGGMVRIDAIEGVTVKAIDWSDHLPKEPVIIDSLAMSIPEDQHALFAPSLHGLLKLMKRSEAELTPLVGMASSESSYRGLMTRYRQQLGLDLTDAAARLLPVKSVAVTGGDLYFATGTDVAILMEAGNAAALLKALELAVTSKAGVKPQRHRDGKLEYLSFVVPDKGISSHLCQIGDLVLVTNSMAQVRRITEVADKRAPALGKSEEFKVFRHRYPKADEHAFIFLSDAAIRRWAGPVTRIGASRRNRALAALNELTCRTITGNEEDLQEYAPLLGRVVISEGRAVSEQYGTAEFLTPISELALGEVSQTEKQAYERWREGYESGWTQVFDPIAIQLKMTGDSVDVDLTVLPLNVNSDIREVMDLAGKAKLSPRARIRPEHSILHLACAIDSKSEFFQQFDQQLVQMMPELKIKPLSWVGESVSIDLIDSLFWEGLGESGLFEQAGNLPLVARVEVKSKIKLGLFLTAMRTLMQTSAPDTFEWINRKYGDRSYVVIAEQAEDDFGESVEICYAIVGKALLITLSERNLKKAMDLEQMELTDEQIETLPKADSLMIDVDPAMFDVIDRIDMGSSAASRMAQLSWNAIHILNEWRRLYPDRDPAVVHQSLFGVSINCPGGKGYRWNAEHLTMESVVFGHRGAPREPEKKQGLLKYDRMHSGMDFIEDGLRLRMHLGPKSKLLALPQPEVGEVLGKGMDLGGYKVGNKLFYRNEYEGIEGTWSWEMKSVEKTPEGTKLNFESPWEEDGESGIWKATYLVDDKGIWAVEGKDEFMTSTYERPSLNLPLELRLNAIHKCDTISQDVHKDEEGVFSETTKTRQEIRVVGKETIKTKAGTFKDCVVIERYTESLSPGFFDITDAKEWYHLGTGMVKSVDQHVVSELIKIEKK